LNNITTGSGRQGRTKKNRIANMRRTDTLKQGSRYANLQNGKVIANFKLGDNQYSGSAKRHSLVSKTANLQVSRKEAAEEMTTGKAEKEVKKRERERAFCQTADTTGQKLRLPNGRLM
jgi:hypothetical protein